MRSNLEEESNAPDMKHRKVLEFASADHDVFERFWTGDFYPRAPARCAIRRPRGLAAPSTKANSETSRRGESSSRRRFLLAAARPRRGGESSSRRRVLLAAASPPRGGASSSRRRVLLAAAAEPPRSLRRRLLEEKLANEGVDVSAWKGGARVVRTKHPLATNVSLPGLSFCIPTLKNQRVVEAPGCRLAIFEASCFEKIPRVRRADMSPTNRGGAAAARGDSLGD